MLDFLSPAPRNRRNRGDLKSEPDSAAIIGLIDEAAPDRVCDFESLVVSRCPLFCETNPFVMGTLRDGAENRLGARIPEVWHPSLPTDYDGEVLIRQDKSRDIIGASAIMTSRTPLPARRDPKRPSDGRGLRAGFQRVCFMSTVLKILVSALPII